MADGKEMHDFTHEWIEQIGFGKFHILVLGVQFTRTFTIGSALSLMTILSPFLRCEMKLTNFQASWIITAVPLTRVFSSFCIGKFADKFGRRNTMVLCFTLHAIFSLQNALSSSLVMIIITRIAIGIFSPVRAATLAYTLEVLPATKRSLISLVKIFYIMGSIFGMVVGILTLRHLNWHWFVVIAEFLPAAASAFLASLLPESPRFLSTNNRQDEAVAVLKDIAKMNGKDPDVLASEISPCLHEYHEAKQANKKEKSKTNWNLVKRVIVVSLLSLVASTIGSTLYVGTMQFGENAKVNFCGDCASQLKYKYRWAMEFSIGLSFILTAILIAKCKRIIGIRTMLVLIGINLIPLYWDLKNWSLISTMVFMIIMLSSFTVFVIVYEAELIPTKYRSFSLGITGSSTHFGSFVGSFLALYFYHENIYICFGVLHFGVLVAIIIAFSISWETKDKALEDL